MNWKRLTIQLLTAVSAGIPLMTVRGQDCRCQPLRPPILLPTTPQSLYGPGSFKSLESASPLLANRRDGSWFQPLSPDHGVFREGSPGPQVTSTSGDLTTSGDLSTPATVTENITGGATGSSTTSSGSGTSSSGFPGNGGSGSSGGSTTLGGNRGIGSPPPAAAGNVGGGSGGSTSSGTSSTTPETANTPETADDPSSDDDSSSLLTDVDPPREVFPDPPIETPDELCPNPDATDTNSGGDPGDAPVVPEPGSLLLMTLGSTIGAFLWYRRASVPTVSGARASRPL